MQAKLSEAARSPRLGTLLVAEAIGYLVTFVLIGREELEAMIAATSDLIPLTVGIGFLVEITLSSGGKENIRKGALRENGRRGSRGESRLAQDWHALGTLSNLSVFRRFVCRRSAFALRIST